MDREFSLAEPDPAPTQPAEADTALVITLRTGERVVARLGLDESGARARLQEVQLALAGEQFVRVGDELVLRADEVRAVELAREPELRFGGESWQGETAATAHSARDEPYDSGWGRSGPSGPFERVRQTVQQRVGVSPSAELVATIGGVAGVLVAALVTDDLDAAGAWLVVGLVLAAYIVSRGIAKAGTEGRGG